jgi:hypothetical protein
MANKSATKKTQGVDLAKLFGAVASNLAENRDSLNTADTYNKDHGDNMVGIFQTISKIVQSKSGLDQAAQLASASKEIRKQSSGSAQLYADGLQRASQEFKGKTITADNAMGLIQALLGGGQPTGGGQQQANPGGDILGSLLGSLGGGQTAGGQQQQADSGGDLLGSLLGSLGGGQAGASQGAQDGLDAGDLLNAGMAFMNAKQKGSSNMEALIGAVLNASPMGQSSHRSQSGSIVASTIMQVLGSIMKK